MISPGACWNGIKTNFNIIKLNSQVNVFVWYESWDDSTNTYVILERVKVFTGFIAHIADGFPSKIYLQDNSFILRFGAIEKGWDEDATLQKIIEDCLPIAQEGFDAERKRFGFTRAIPKLTYSTEKKNVQAVTTPLSFRNWGGRSPFDTVQKLMQELVLYGGVSNDFNVFVGEGVTESTRPIIKLDTRYNIIEREIVPIDGRFVDYDVKVFGILKNGRQYTATGGSRTSKSAAEKSEFEQKYGEPIRGFSSNNTVEGIKDFADKLLVKLKGERNKGRLKLLLYPKLEIMDWVEYTDSVFEDLSGGYYILEYSFTADETGYYQNVSVTDQIYSL